MENETWEWSWRRRISDFVQWSVDFRGDQGVVHFAKTFNTDSCPALVQRHPLKFDVAQRYRIFRSRLTTFPAVTRT